MVRRIIGWAVIIAVGLSGLGLAADEKAKGKWQAPSEAAEKANPENKNAAAATTGRKIFRRACVNCHGDDGSGQNASGANLRSAQVQNQSDGALFWKITNGNTTAGMPSFAALAENDRWDIVVFLRTLKDSDEDSAKPNK